MIEKVRTRNEDQKNGVDIVRKALFVAALDQGTQVGVRKSQEVKPRHDWAMIRDRLCIRFIKVSRGCCQGFTRRLHCACRSQR